MEPRTIDDHCWHQGPVVHSNDEVRSRTYSSSFSAGLRQLRRHCHDHHHATRATTLHVTFTSTAPTTSSPRALRHAGDRSGTSLDGHQHHHAGHRRCARPDIVVQFQVQSDLRGDGRLQLGTSTAQCTSYWFTITNTKNADVTVTGTAAASRFRPISRQRSQLDDCSSGADAQRRDDRHGCGAPKQPASRRSRVTKELVGPPAAPETYTIRVSRLVGDTYVERDHVRHRTPERPRRHPPAVDAWIPPASTTSSRRSSRARPTPRWSAPTSSSCRGHLGETVSVVVTNGYASVQIDKASSTPTVTPGGQITYTLQATNTGGLTLNPVVIDDRLPALESLVSASVAGGAGQCVLTETTRPQLLRCTMSDALAPGADDQRDHAGRRRRSVGRRRHRRSSTRRWSTAPTPWYQHLDHEPGTPLQRKSSASMAPTSPASR